VVTGQRVGVAPGGSPILDLSILELDGSVRELIRGVVIPVAEGHHVSPDRSSLAFVTPCCPSTVVVVARSGGARREIASSPTALRLLSWDADGYVLYWSGGNAIDAVRPDGSRYQVPLGLPAGVTAIGIEPGARTADGAANVFSITADGPFPGTAQNNVADRTLIGRELRPYQSGAALAARVSATELLTHPSGSFGAYDLTTGVTRTLATIADDDAVPPTAVSGRIVLTSPHRTVIASLSIDGYPSPAGTFSTTLAEGEYGNAMLPSLHKRPGKSTCSICTRAIASTALAVSWLPATTSTTNPSSWDWVFATGSHPAITPFAP